MLTGYRARSQLGPPNQPYDYQGGTTHRQAPEDAQFRTCGVSSRFFAKGKVYLSVNIHGRQRLCLLDSGSEVTLILTSYIGRKKIQWTDRKLWAANGTEIPVRGWISLTAYVGETRVEIDGLVMIMSRTSS